VAQHGRYSNAHSRLFGGGAAECSADYADGTGKRLPMQDHNTRIIVFGTDGEQARAVATEIAKNAFHNVSYFGGTVEELMQGL